MSEKRSKQNQTFVIKSDKPALTKHENNNSRFECFTDQELSIVTTGHPQSAPQHLLKISDSESFSSIPQDYFSSTSTYYNSYIESGTAIRVDCLFKPLLRRFRHYFRDRFDSNHNKRSYHRWSIQKYLQHVHTYMKKELALPDELLDEESIGKMLTILFPQSNKR